MLESSRRQVDVAMGGTVASEPASVAWVCLAMQTSEVKGVVAGWAWSVGGRGTKTKQATKIEERRRGKLRK